jgi:hypothetical protein
LVAIATTSQGKPQDCPQQRFQFHLKAGLTEAKNAGFQRFLAAVYNDF